MTVNRNLYLKSAEVSDGNEEHDIEKWKESVLHHKVLENLAESVFTVD
jgi:hypothetical protein